MGKCKGKTGDRKTGEEKIAEQNTQWQENIHIIQHIRGHEKKIKGEIGKMLMQMDRFRIENSRYRYKQLVDA